MTELRNMALWQSAWPDAKKIWSDFVRLREPVWCITTEEARKEGLKGSFAMIRLKDHRIVIDLEAAEQLGVSSYALQILAHEIGHHIYTPANLYDNSRLLSRIRWGLAGLENRAPFVANLYEDLLINDRLHRLKKLDMAAVFEQVNKGIPFSKLWTLYMRSYEYLWKLKRGTLAVAPSFYSDELDADASLMAALVRSFANNWIEGGGRFAALLFPYLMEEKDYEAGRHSLIRLLDAEAAGQGAGVISGLTELDVEGMLEAIDPRSEALKGADSGREETGTTPLPVAGKNEQGGTGPRQRYLNPGTYIDFQQQLNPNMDAQQLTNNYYREIALPHLIPFPADSRSPESHTSPEGTTDWDISDPVEEIDWLETAIYSPHLLPGHHTRKRIYGLSPDEGGKSIPCNVYIGVDCSGSMTNPSRGFSWPVLAATIIALSALRAGAKVMGCLSGEPGSYLQTNGFTPMETEVLTVLTSYLGTGYAFGIGRLEKPFGKPLQSKTHIVLVTDDDIFAMLDGKRMDKPCDHWALIETALTNAGGEGSIVLHSHRDWHSDQVERLQSMGWRVYYVTDEEELLDFAADFAQNRYGNRSSAI